MTNDKPHPHQALPQPLSQRESEVLSLLVEGLSNGEIAERLVIAYTTVKWYVRQIFNKLGVDSRQDAIARAQSLGLADSMAATLPKHNLPAPITPFIGREREVQDITQMLREPATRLITILAPGGMGKTRLALAAAETLLLHFPNGVYFVPLAPLTSPDQIILAIADAVGFQFSPDSRTPQQQLLDFLHNKHLLLVLDNFEHLLDGAPLVSDILQAAPLVKTLVTSRERLNLSGESVYSLDGLTYPEQPGADDILSYSAVELFVKSAQRARADFVLNGNAAEIVRVCQLAQGMPLAIELAAAWVGGLSTAEIAQEITRSLDFLQTRMRDVPERLRSVRAVFESAWARLTTDEQAVFRKLSVFRGGCTREAAQAVTGADVMTLTALVDKALLRRYPNTRRYEVHELLRQYAAGQLELSGESQRTHHAHAVYFARFASCQAKNLRGAQQLQALNLIEADMDNIRQGFERAAEAHEVDLVEPFADTWLFFDMQARWQEGRQIFEQALHHLGREENRAVGRLLLGQGLFLYRLLFPNQALEAAQHSLRIMRQHGQPRDSLLPLMVLGIAFDQLEQFHLSHDIYEELYPLAQRYGDDWEKTTSLFLLGADAIQHKDLDRARELMEQAYSEYQQAGNSWGAAYPLMNLAFLAAYGKDYERAEQLYNALLILAEENHFPSMIAHSLDGLSTVARRGDDLIKAKDLLEKCMTISREMGSLDPALEIRMGELVSEMDGYLAAKSYFRKAFESVKALQSVTALLYLVVVIAEKVAQSGAKEQAVELISLYFHHPNHETLLLSEPDSPENLVAQLKNELPPDTFAAAWQRGEAVSSIEILLEKILYSTP